MYKLPQLILIFSLTSTASQAQTYENKCDNVLHRIPTFQSALVGTWQFSGKIKWRSSSRSRSYNSRSGYIYNSNDCEAISDANISFTISPKIDKIYGGMTGVYEFQRSEPQFRYIGDDSINSCTPSYEEKSRLGYTDGRIVFKFTTSQISDGFCKLYLNAEIFSGSSHNQDPTNYGFRFIDETTIIRYDSENGDITFRKIR